MTQILVAYVVAVIFNRTFNLFMWCATRRSTPRAYYREHGMMLAATALLHLPLFALWYLGWLLPVINGIISAALAGVDAIPGVDLSSIQLPTVITPAVTLMYGWPIDSVTSRLGKWWDDKFAFFPKTNGGTTPPAKETP